MTLEIFWIHVALSLTLFLLLNWVGRHSISSGYITLSAFLRNDEAPLFNLLFRIVGPVVFVILVASFLYAVELDRFVNNIWLVVLYYFAGRLIYVLFFSRFYLVNWWREGFLWFCSIGLAWLLYQKVIQFKENLLPDVADLKNQFWILLILFIYSALNNVRFGHNGSIERKENYLRRVYKDSKASYGKIISPLATDALSESLIYSILLYEQFNRPPFVRVVEHMVYPWLSKSLGPMQVKTERRISDAQSVSLGAQRIMNLYHEAYAIGKKKAEAKGIIFDPKSNSQHRHFMLYKVTAGYNRDDDYHLGIMEMHSQLIDLLYPELKFPFEREHWSESLI